MPCTAMVWDCLIVGLLWLHNIQYLGRPNVTKATFAFRKVGRLVLPRTSCYNLSLCISTTRLRVRGSGGMAPRFLGLDTKFCVSSGSLLTRSDSRNRRPVSIGWAD
jgi:hypothetical protein